VRPTSRIIVGGGLGYAAIVGLALLASCLAGCYATTGPKPPSCSADPNQPGCLPPIHDMRPR
jgi:hypothetical protein